MIIISFRWTKLVEDVLTWDQASGSSSGSLHRLYKMLQNEIAGDGGRLQELKDLNRTMRTGGEYTIPSLVELQLMERRFFWTWVLIRVCASLTVGKIFHVQASPWSTLRGVSQRKQRNPAEDLMGEEKRLKARSAGWKIIRGEDGD